MGLSPSKRVETILQNSPEFDTACNSVYEECLNLTQHAFSGVLPYQLSDASTRLHLTLSTANPLVKKWVPLPPTRIQIDKALEIVIERFKVDSRGGEGGEETLNSSEFKAFAIELFKDSIVSNAGKAVLQRVPIGIAGIAGIAGVGIVTRSGKDLVGTFMGVYALGFVTAVYLSLS